jgi:uncharacterized protein YceK
MMKIILLVAILPSIVSCASTVSIWAEDTNPDACLRKNHIYGGVKIDAALIQKAVTDENTSTWYCVLGLIDIIPSALFDTLQLPFTVHSANKQKQECLGVIK